MAREPVRIELRAWHKDVGGYKGSDLTSKIGTRWFHPKTGGLYRIIGVGFDSERERWIYHYTKEGLDEDDSDLAFPFHHLPEDFHREGRFMRVHA